MSLTPHRPKRSSGRLADFHGKPRRRPGQAVIRSMTTPAPTRFPHPSPNVRVWTWHVELGAYDQWAAFDTAVDQELERVRAWETDRIVNPDRALPLVPAEAPPAIRELFLARDRDALDELLGFDEFDAKGAWSAWRPGRANLSPREATALRMRLERGFGYREIAQHLNPRARRFEDEPSLEEIRQLLYQARRKLREAVGAAGAPGGTPSITSCNTSQPSSIEPLDASEPTTTTPRTSYRTPSFATSSAASSYAMSSPS